MRGSAKSKVVTSGRLTGGLKGPLSRRRVTPDPGPACPEAAYSLYSTSTEPEDQVCSLHQGLDRCAALLTGILQAEQADPPRAVKGVAARPTPRSALRKKTIRNRKTDQRGRQPVQPVPGTTTPAVKLHPPERQTSIHPPETSIQPPERQTSTHPPERQTSIHPPERQSDDDREEEEFVPVRDMDDQSSAVRQTCPLEMSNMQLQCGQVDKVLQDSHSREETETVKTGQCLLGELKALIAGQGSVAERLLSGLQQVMGAGSSNIWTEPDLLSLHSQNPQIHSILCVSTVLTLQEELTELQKSLEDTQSRLTHREAENAAIQSDLEATRSRLLHSEREKRELSSLAQQRLEDIGNLKRVLQRPPGVDVSVSDSQPPADRMANFLMSLGRLQPAATEQACAEREQETPRDTGTDVRPGDQVAHLDPSHRLQGGRRPSRWDVESVRSGWSARSGSSFDTRDEAAFRDGLAALDKSIAALQRTMHLDLCL